MKPFQPRCPSAQIERKWPATKDRKLDLDPIEARRVNMVHAADLPYRMPTGEVLDEVTPRETLEHGLKTFDVEAFRRRQQAERAQGVYRGLERASPFICVKAAASPS